MIIRRSILIFLFLFFYQTDKSMEIVDKVGDISKNSKTELAKNIFFLCITLKVVSHLFTSELLAVKNFILYIPRKIIKKYQPVPVMFNYTSEGISPTYPEIKHNSLCDNTIYYKEISQIYKNFCDNKDNNMSSILLYGAPGTGKTFLAKTLFNNIIAENNTKAPKEKEKIATLNFNPSLIFQAPFINSNNQAVTIFMSNLESLLKTHDKILLFIDEADSLGSRETSGIKTSGSEETKKAINTFLTQYSSLKETYANKLFTISATNFQDAQSIDNALIRQGRLGDKEIHFKPYNINESIKLLNKFIDEKKLKWTEESFNISIENYFKIINNKNEFLPLEIKSIVNDIVDPDKKTITKEQIIKSIINRKKEKKDTKKELIKNENKRNDKIAAQETVYAKSDVEAFLKHRMKLEKKYNLYEIFHSDSKDENFNHGIYLKYPKDKTVKESLQHNEYKFDILALKIAFFGAQEEKYYNQIIALSEKIISSESHQTSFEKVLGKNKNFDNNIQKNAKDIIDNIGNPLIILKTPKINNIIGKYVNDSLLK